MLIIGGGASGVLIAAHLLRSGAALSIRIAERQRHAGAGVAYATDNPLHLLNVRAAGMSAYGDRPDHFADWLTASRALDRHEGDVGACFVRRSLYRRYLQDVLRTASEAAPNASVAILPSEIVDLREAEDGIVATTAEGQSLAFDRAVIATGLEPSAEPFRNKIFDGWSKVPAIPAEASVVVVGTGLTMVDHVAGLIDAGHRGPITAISRDGRLPQSHRPTTPHPIAEHELPPALRLATLLGWLRRRIATLSAQGIDWRCVVDGLRPHTQRIWAALSAADRRRFLRHGTSLWNTHRHRMPQTLAQRMQIALASGQFRVVKGRVLAVDTTQQGVLTLAGVAGDPAARNTFASDVMIDCRGPKADIRQTRNRLLRNIIASGTARPDPLGLGLDVTEGLELLSAPGRRHSRIFAIGPITRGVFWECTAVPDIRVQADSLARTIIRLAGG